MVESSILERWLDLGADLLRLPATRPEVAAGGRVHRARNVAREDDALTLSALPSLFFFTIMGLGLAAPYLVLSLFPKLVGLLPRPGAWMAGFKVAMAFPMFATVVWLV